MFCAAKYRGGVQRTEGLKKQKGLKKHRQQQNQISHSPSAVSRSNIEGEGENVLYCYIENTSNCKERHVSHSSPVFCAANIGEVAEGQRG